MPICSYLVFPKTDAQNAVMETLAQIPRCDVFPAENRDDVMVLVTETQSLEEEEVLQDTLKEIEDIQCLVLAFGEVDADLSASRT